MIVGQKHPYYKGATKALAKQTQDIAIDTLKAQVQAWALDNLLDKTFTKEKLKARLTTRSLSRILREPHTQKYHQLLSLYDLDRLLKQAIPVRTKEKGWRYFQIDIHDMLSLIHIRGADGYASIHNITERG